MQCTKEITYYPAEWSEHHISNKNFKKIVSLDNDIKPLISTMQSLEYHLRLNKDIASVRTDKHYWKRKEPWETWPVSFWFIGPKFIYKYHIKEMNVNLAKWNGTKGKTNLSKVPLFINFFIWRTRTYGCSKTCIYKTLKAVPTHCPGRSALDLTRKSIVFCRKVQVKLSQLWSDSKKGLNHNSAD